MLTRHTEDALSWHASSRIPVPHGMFTRRGGTGDRAYDSLNLSFGVGDCAKVVLNNRERIKQQLKIRHLVSSNQVHGDSVALVESVDKDHELADYDALITNQPGVGLLIQQADCQAILLHDPIQEVIAAVHNGWRGSVANIIGRTIGLMEQNFGVHPSDIRAVISPSLGPCCGEFINYRKELPVQFHSFQPTENHFDFRAISRSQLNQAGVGDTNIEICSICTACNTEYFSYRRARKSGGGRTGRNGSVIALPVDKMI